MNLKDRLQNDLKEAMRNNNEVQKRTLRMALAAIRLLEVEKGVQLDDNAVLGILQKEVKARHEAIADAERAGRADLAAASREELAILEGYLPQAMSEAELETLVRQGIAEVGAQNLQQMGLVMKWLMPRLQGRASGEQASQMVRRLLS